MTEEKLWSIDETLTLFHKIYTLIKYWILSTFSKYSKFQAPTPLSHFTYLNLRQRQVVQHKIKMNHEREQDDNPTSSLDRKVYQ